MPHESIAPSTAGVMAMYWPSLLKPVSSPAQPSLPRFVGCATGRKPWGLACASGLGITGGATGGMVGGATGAGGGGAGAVASRGAGASNLTVPIGTNGEFTATPIEGAAPGGGATSIAGATTG